ncbi:MAG: FAD:protein FMN transferase [Nitrospirota bacterium]
MTRRLAAILLVLISLVACAPEEATYRKSAIIMDTLVTITVVSDSGQEAEGAMDAAFDEIRRLEKLLSFWTEDSEIAAIYQNAGVRPVKVSPETLDIVERSLYIAERTGGAFDPTVGPVMRLWDFHEKRMPTKKEIEGKLPLVDYRKVVVDRDNSTVYLEVKGMSFDTGGIAKGYAVDRAVEVLKESGMESGLVAIAGDIRGFGPRTWRIGIRDPRAEGDEGVMATLELKDKAISTSGDYERYFILDGKRYHHLLDPKTGLPARGVWSASVVADEAVLTDGFSTGIFVMGPERGLALAEELDVEAVIVADGGEVLITPGIKDRITWNW